MDIIDILLAKKLTPQEQVETYAKKAEAAVRDAQTAISDAQLAIDAVDDIRAETEQMNSDSQQALENANKALTDTNNALEAVQEAIDNIDTTILETAKEELVDIADDEIDKLALALTITNSSTAIDKTLKITYPNGAERLINSIVKYYKTTGNNEDGTMTQKAITEAIRKGGGGSIAIEGKPGSIIILGSDGKLIASDTVLESDIIEALIKSGSYNSAHALGLKIDYENKAFERTQEAIGLSIGSGFNKYKMYGGRKRCLVDNDGKIIAFYGDPTYNDSKDSGYQTMVYQPKFYYSRVPMKLESAIVGFMIRSEVLMISEEPQQGFKLHPLFINELGEELDYVLLPAYDGSVETNDDNSYTDNAIANFSTAKLSSVAGAKPISGLNNDLTPVMAEQLAQNRGASWHITNMQAESANQMLEMIEFGMMNGQTALESGIGNVPNNATANCSATTGSTSSLGNNSGAATSTSFTIAGKTTTYYDPGRRAISYRGMENPWGNIWRMVGGINLWGDGYAKGGVPYICRDFNYSLYDVTNYDSVGFCLPSVQDWISAMGYGGEEFDWVYLPAECSPAGNSALPVGDNAWLSADLNGINMIVAGGSWAFDVSNGPFYYGCDKHPTQTARSYSARLMLVPHLNDQFYSYNVSLWKNKIGG